MKKPILLAILILLLFPLAAESGLWLFDPLFTRLPDGTLIPADREYSRPFLGMEEIHFIDEYLVRIKASGREFRAFYESLPGDADNVILLLTFKGGEELHLRTVSDRATGELIFHYEIPEGFFSVEEETMEDEFLEEDELNDAEESMPADQEPDEDDPVSEETEIVKIRQICGRIILEN